VNGHVERRIIEDEAAIIRDIFRRAAAGDGLKGIAKALNAAGALSPRAQQGRPRGWSPSSVREVLHRDIYRGLVTWNKTKKRDADGEHRQHDRPRNEWISVPAEHLRIVSDDVSQMVHERRRNKQRSTATMAPPAVSGRGIRRKYALAGFGRCAACGASMIVVSRPSSTGRSFTYACGANGTGVSASAATPSRRKWLPPIRPCIVRSDAKYSGRVSSLAR